MDFDPPDRPAVGTAQRLTLAAFGALIALGCGLRFWKLGEDGLWHDELWTVVGAGRPFLEMVRDWILVDPHPPGYFLFYFAWVRLLPDAEFWARLPNALAGVLTVVYLLFGARRVLTRDERVYAAAFASFSWLYIFYAVNVKQYSATLLLATIATVAYLDIASQRHVARRTGITLTVALVGLAYLDHFGMAYGWFLLGLLALTLRHAPAQLRPLGRIAIAFGLAYAPIAYFLRAPMLYSGNDEQSGLAMLLADLIPSLFFDDRTTVLSGLVLLGVGLGVRMRMHRQERVVLRSPRNAHVLLACSGFAAVLLALAVVQPILVVRYFIVLFPVTLIGVAILAAAAFPLARGWLAVLPLIFFTRAAIVDARAVEGMERQAWAESVDLVLASAEPQDDVYVLGSSPDKTMLEYLRAGDVDGAVYSRNVDYFAYYFRRRGADDVTARLQVVSPTTAAANELANRYRQSGKAVYILAGHHIQFDDEARWVLEQAADTVETTWLYSTIVYEARF